MKTNNDYVPFFLRFTPSLGIFFEFKSFQRDLVSVLGHTFDGAALKVMLEEQWTAFTQGHCPEVWYPEKGTDEWKRSEASNPSLSWILKSSPSCGLLFETPFKQMTNPIFVFVEIERNPNPKWRLSYPYHAKLSIRDERANLLEPIEVIADDADDMTRSERFRILMHKFRYFDNEPIVDNPSLFLLTLGRIANDFDERDLARSLLDCFEEDLAKDGSIGDLPFLCTTNLLTRKGLSSSFSSNRTIPANQPISLLFSKGFKTHVLFGNDIENEVPVPLSDFYPAIDRFLNRKSEGFDINSLASISERRNWDFTNDEGKVISLGSLNKYLELTFGRIDEDIQTAEAQQEDCQEIVPTPNGQGKLFCTGLRHREFGSYIYACCLDPDEDGIFQTVKWAFRRRKADGIVETPSELDFEDHRNRRNHGLPYPANWTREPEKLVFQYQNGSKSNIFFNYKHMFDDHLDRIKTDGTDASGIGDQLTFPEFQKRVEDAWPATRKLLEANYKNAIPTYYEGDIQLLVPLFLDKRKTSTPSAALVLARDRTGRHFYYAPTFLTLDMARNNALVITRVDDSWLTPDPLPGTIAWLKGRLVDEPDEKRQEKIRSAIKDLSNLTFS